MQTHHLHPARSEGKGIRVMGNGTPTSCRYPVKGCRTEQLSRLLKQTICWQA
ncbi:hypothetical protein H6G86_28660 [Nostoc sp. FACHB-133]|nr:hypothetical protein [Nostoc sp. FACHB-133]